MAYSTSSPPVLVTQAMTNSVPRMWFLTGTDTAATVDTTGYITNGGALGMKVNDLVTYWKTDSKSATIHVVVTVSSTAPGAVDLADGTTVGSATNSD